MAKNESKAIIKSDGKKMGIEIMTDEEKAEEYMNKRPFIHLLGRNTLFIQKEFKNAILWAFAEGRKGKNYFNKFVQKCKENEELEAQIEELQLNLKSRNDLVEELTMQIEKMKNVGNCKHAMTCANWNEKQTMLGCMKFCKNCKEWEMEE